MTETALKPWPRDAVIVVCSYPATARRDHMESVVPTTCRDCGRDLVADGRTLRTAWGLPQRRGRPIECLCVECYRAYRPEFDMAIDHRRPR